MITPKMLGILYISRAKTTGRASCQRIEEPIEDTDPTSSSSAGADSLTARRPFSSLPTTDVPSVQALTANSSSQEKEALLPSDQGSEPAQESSAHPEAHKATEKTAVSSSSRPVHTRIETYTMILAVLSMILIIVALSFIGWMWFGDRISTTWRRIMLDDFAKQAVTI